MRNHHLVLMNAALDRAIAENGLQKYAQLLHKVAVPKLELVKSKEGMTRGCSKVGGVPDVPPGFKWPEQEKYIYRFLAQFDLAKVSHVDCHLPKAGLLSLFYIYDGNDFGVWQPEYLRGFLFRENEAVQPMNPPEASQAPDGWAVDLQPGLALPSWNDFEESNDECDPDDEYSYDDLWSSVHGVGSYLLGSPTYFRAAYPPILDPDSCLLFSFQTDDGPDWYWNQGSHLMGYIEKKRLAQGDLSQIEVDAD